MCVSTLVFFFLFILFSPLLLFPQLSLTKCTLALHRNGLVLNYHVAGSGSKKGEKLNFSFPVLWVFNKCLYCEEKREKVNRLLPTASALLQTTCGHSWTNSPLSTAHPQEHWPLNKSRQTFYHHRWRHFKWNTAGQRWTVVEECEHLSPPPLFAEEKRDLITFWYLLTCFSQVSANIHAIDLRQYATSI